LFLWGLRGHPLRKPFFLILTVGKTYASGDCSKNAYDARDAASGGEEI
jgi:hypothetical protein